MSINFRGACVDGRQAQALAAGLSDKLQPWRLQEDSFLSDDFLRPVEVDEIPFFEISLRRAQSVRLAWLEVFAPPGEVLRAINLLGDEWTMIRSLRFDVSMAGFAWVGADLEAAIDREINFLSRELQGLSERFNIVRGFEENYLDGLHFIEGRPAEVLRGGGLGTSATKGVVDSLGHLAILMEHLENTFLFEAAPIEEAER